MESYSAGTIFWPALRTGTRSFARLAFALALLSAFICPQLSLWGMSQAGTFAQVVCDMCEHPEFVSAHVHFISSHAHAL